MGYKRGRYTPKEENIKKLNEFLKKIEKGKTEKTKNK